MALLNSQLVFGLLPVALPGDQILKIWTNGFKLLVVQASFRSKPNMFVKLFKSLAPGRATRGPELKKCIAT